MQAAHNILHVGDIDEVAYQNERAILEGLIVEDVGFQFFCHQRKRVYKIINIYNTVYFNLIIITEKIIC
jgi:hypothetical protein